MEKCFWVLKNVKNVKNVRSFSFVKSHVFWNLKKNGKYVSLFREHCFQTWRQIWLGQVKLTKYWEMLPYQTQCDVGLIIERGDFIRSFSIAKYWRNRYGPKALCFRVVRLSVCACVCTCIRVDAFSDRLAVDLQFIFAFYFFFNYSINLL